MVERIYLMKLVDKINLFISEVKTKRRVGVDAMLSNNKCLKFCNQSLKIPLAFEFIICVLTFDSNKSLSNCWGKVLPSTQFAFDCTF